MAFAQEDRGLLARIAFFLARDGVVPEAETVFNGLAASAPEKDGPVVGQALCLIIRGEHDKAIAMLDERLKKDSPIASALSLYKLLALGMAGRLESAKEFRQSMAARGMTDAVATADSLLEDFAKRRDADA
jgi:hypothetical protein